MLYIINMSPASSPVQVVKLQCAGRGNNNVQFEWESKYNHILVCLSGYEIWGGGGGGGAFWCGYLAMKYWEGVWYHISSNRAHSSSSERFPGGHTCQCILPQKSFQKQQFSPARD